MRLRVAHVTSYINIGVDGYILGSRVLGLGFEVEGCKLSVQGWSSGSTLESPSHMKPKLGFRVQV